MPRWTPPLVRTQHLPPSAKTSRWLRFIALANGVPVLSPGVETDGTEAEGGRRIRLVDVLSARWGYQSGGGLATTWFELVQGLSQGEWTWRVPPVDPGGTSR